jgi:hypothetical protein
MEIYENEDDSNLSEIIATLQDSKDPPIVLETIDDIKPGKTRDPIRY